MYYYDPNDRRPRRWALLGTALYVLLFAAAFALISFDFTPPAHPEAELYIDLTDAPASAVSRPVPNAGEQRRPETPAAVERTAQTAGELKGGGRTWRCAVAGRNGSDKTANGGYRGGWAAVGGGPYGG